ncbi:PIN domain-containing protein [Halocatena pleomorpha]|uniref:Ribonuclease VapC n=1 Tax=Halocatena pleomorpha TaxID=1785090 RepID=A0A3P3R4R3_9EURY|nr:PIN domain-containing protein [Halocatena pleomorpha]RRJ28335.1 type II toxin-antitoxin system VapC family toxin [Halocatena pleomorpha]
MIEDTSFIIDVLDGDEAALDVLELIERERRPEKVAAITVLELYEGIQRVSNPDAERQRVLSVLDSKPIVTADHDIMKRAGELSGQLITDGQRIDREDCVIAATALSEDEPLVTANTAHFDRVPDLDIRSY